jgi:hypothetical protein
MLNEGDLRTVQAGFIFYNYVKEGEKQYAKRVLLRKDSQYRYHGSY